MNIVLLLATSLIFGGPVRAPAQQTANSGCDMPATPTVGDCWECFQDLLEDCDADNPRGPRREACYEGANQFLEWCLGQTGLHIQTPGVLDASDRFEAIVAYHEGELPKHTLLSILTE